LSIKQLLIYHSSTVPFGTGSMTAAIVIGKLLDRNFHRHARLLGITITKGRQSDIRNFPIERARLEVVAPIIVFACLVIMAYGWVIHAGCRLAGPLILLYPLAFSITGSFMALSTLVVDLNIQTPGTATAAGNWVRCWIGAGAVALIGPLLDSIGTGWISVLVAGIWVIFSPLLWMVLKWGPTWREQKVVRDEGREETEKKKSKNGDVEKGGDEVLPRSEDDEASKS
jgi:hypothetical protein